MKLLIVNSVKLFKNGWYTLFYLSENIPRGELCNWTKQKIGNISVLVRIFIKTMLWNIAVFIVLYISYDQLAQRYEAMIFKENKHMSRRVASYTITAQFPFKSLTTTEAAIMLNVSDHSHSCLWNYL